MNQSGIELRRTTVYLVVYVVVDGLSQRRRSPVLTDVHQISSPVVVPRIVAVGAGYRKAGRAASAEGGIAAGDGSWKGIKPNNGRDAWASADQSNVVRERDLTISRAEALGMGG